MLKLLIVDTGSDTGIAGSNTCRLRLQVHSSIEGFGLCMKPVHFSKKLSTSQCDWKIANMDVIVLQIILLTYSGETYVVNSVYIAERSSAATTNIDYIVNRGHIVLTQVIQSTKVIFIAQAKLLAHYVELPENRAVSYGIGHLLNDWEVGVRTLARTNKGL